MSARSPRIPRSLVSGDCVAGHGLFVPIMMFVTLAFTGPVEARPFGVARTGGDAIAAIKSLTPPAPYRRTTRCWSAVAAVTVPIFQF
jgi:hypothetical protein